MKLSISKIMVFVLFYITKILKIKEIRNFFLYFFIINLIQPTGIRQKIMMLQKFLSQLIRQKMLICRNTQIHI